MQKRRQNRKEYVVLFKKLQAVEWLEPINEKEKKRLQEMEEFLSFEDIIYFRSLARRELAKEQAIADSKKGEFYSSVNRTKGFFGFWKSNEPKMSIQLTKEQQEEIYKSMEYDEIALSATIEMPPDYIQNVLQVQVSAIIFTIIGSREGEDPLMKSYLNNISFKMSQRQQGFRIDLDLESFNVIDHNNVDSLFPYIITSTPRYKCGINNKKLSELDSPTLHSSSSNLNTLIQNNNNNNSNSNDNNNNNNNNINNHLFNITFETNPISSTYDYRLSLILNTMEVVVNKPQIERLIEFATPEENVNLFPLSSVAMEELILLKEMTIFQLREVINHHKTIDLYVDAKAPTVIITEHANRVDTSLIIVDLGSCLMHSDLSQKSAKVKDSIDRPLLLTELETPVKESDLYDHYRATLSSIKVMLARNDQEWWRATTNGNTSSGNSNSNSNSSVDVSNGFPLIEEMAINLHIQSCIEPNELSLALFKVSGTLPEVKINISDESYLQLYRMSKTLAAESTHSSNAYNQLMDTLYTTKQQSETVVDVSQMEIKLSEAYRQVLSKRKIFEGEFTLEKVLVDVHSSSNISSLFNNGNNNNNSNGNVGINQPTNIRLIQLRINELQLSLKKKTYDYFGSLLLAKMEIEDCLEKNSRFSSLVTSQSRYKSTETKKLISISHHIIEKDSPEYSGIDTDIDFNFGELNMNYNPRSIGQVLTFLDYCFEETYKVQEELLHTAAATEMMSSEEIINDIVLPVQQSPSKTQTSTSLSLSSTTSIPPPASSQQQAVTATNLSVIRAKANVHALSISLNDDGNEIGMFSINRFVIKECTLNGREVEVDGHLDSITIESFIDSQSPEHESFKILTPKNQDVSMATFKYKSYSNRSVNKTRDFDTEIDLDLRSIRVTVLVDFILKTKSLVQLPFKTVKYASLYRYQTEYTNNNENDNSNSNQQQQQQLQLQQQQMEIQKEQGIKEKKTNYRIFLESPQLILSSSDKLSTTDDKIISELGSIEISTVLRKSMVKNADGQEAEVEWQVINATLSDMNMKTFKAGKYHQVLHNLSINTSIQQLLCWSKTQLSVSKSVVPLQQLISVDIGEIALEFQDLEHSLIFTITKDVIEKISARAKEKQTKKEQEKQINNNSRKQSTGIPMDIDAIISKLSVNVERFTLLLQLEQYDFGQLTLSKINVHSQTTRGNVTRFNGDVQFGQVVDMRPAVKDIELFETIFQPLQRNSNDSNNNNPLLKFSFISHEPPSLNGWDSELTLDVEPTVINASAGFLFGMKDFFLLPFVKRLSSHTAENPNSPDFEMPTLESIDMSIISKMKLNVVLNRPTIQLPVSPFSKDIVEMTAEKLEITNRYLNWPVNSFDIPVESMMISLSKIILSSVRGDDRDDRKQFTRIPVDLAIDYQSLESVFTNTVDVILGGLQPTKVQLSLTPISLAIDESDFAFFIDMIAQAFRALDDNPPLKLKKRDPYIMELLFLRANPDNLAKILDIHGMEIAVCLQSIELILSSHVDTHDPFATISIEQCLLNVNMATVPREKKMHVSGAVKQLRVYDTRTQLNHSPLNNEMVFYCTKDDLNMMEFKYLSYSNNNNKSRLYSSMLDFNMNGLLTYGHPAFLLRVWDFVVVNFTSVFGTYTTDKYCPDEQVAVPNDSRMKMNVCFDHPLIVLRQSYDCSSDNQSIVYVEPDTINIANEFTKLSEIEAMTRGSEYSDAMIIKLNNTTLNLLQPQQEDHQLEHNEKYALATNYNIEIMVESKPEYSLGDISSNATSTYSIKTNDLRLSCNSVQFDRFYQCLNHALECQYQLDHEYQKRFLKPGFTPTQTDLFALVEVDSIVLDLIDLESQKSIALVSFNEFKIDSAMLEPGMTVTGSLSHINVVDQLSGTAIVKPHGSEYATLFFTYKSHSERTADGWDTELESTIKNILLVPFPLSLLNDIKQFLLDPLTHTPIAQRPPVRLEQPRMKLSSIIKDSRVMLYDPAVGPVDHLLFSVDCLEMHNSIDRQTLGGSGNASNNSSNLIEFDLERWKYDIEGLSMSLHRTDQKTTRLLSNLELTANTDTIRDYDHFLNRFQEVLEESTLQLELPPNVKTNIEIQELYITLSRSNYCFLMDLYNTYIKSTSKTSSSNVSSSVTSTSTTTTTTATAATNISDEASVESELMQSIVANLISLKMNSFSVVLIDGIYGLAEVSFYDFDTVMSVYKTSGDDGATEVSGSLNRLQFMDQRRQSCQSRYKNIVNSTFDSRVEFNFRPFTNDPTWTQKLDVKLDNVIFTPLFDLFTEVQEYLRLDASDTSDSKSPVRSRLKYDIIMNHTKLLIPMNIELNNNYLSGDIQEIQISNAFIGKQDLDIDQLSLKITSMSLAEHIENGLEQTRIMSDLNMDITMKTNLYHQLPAPSNQPLTNIVMDVGNIQMSFSPHQYLFFYNMMNLTLRRYYEFRYGPYPAQPQIAQVAKQEGEEDNLVDQVEEEEEQQEEQLDMNVLINIQLLKLTMNTANYNPSELTLKRLSMEVDMTKKKMVVDGKAKDLIITSNETNYQSLYNVILEKVDRQKEFFTFKYISHAATEPVEWDTEFLINLRSINMVSMIGSLTRVKDFLMEPLSTPIVSPPNALVRAHASKMRQVINMEPWTLFIPATDTTKDAVIIKFGSTNMTNFYRDIKIDDSETVHPVEVLQLTISKLSLFSERDGNRVSISNQASCFVEIEKLFSIKDSLAIEDQKMLVKIPSLELIFSQEDYRFFYYIFTSDWMRFSTDESKRPPVPPPTPHFDGRRFIYVTPDHEEQKAIAEHQFESPLGFINLTADSPRQMTIYTEIGRISMAISHIDPILDPIASLEINQVNVNYLLYRNNIVKTEMTVDTVQLVDERQSSDSVFKEILTRKKQTKKGDPQLLVQSWVDARRNRNFVSIHCDHPLLFVSPDSIIPIMSFFTSIQQPTKYVQEKKRSQQPAPVPSHFRFYLNVTKPKMLLVEDETQQNTRALVIKMPIEFHYSLTPEQNLTMELKAPKCQVFRNTPFAETEGTSSTPITNSFSFNFLYLHFVENDQRTVNIKFQPLNIFLTYKEMILINRIINNLSTKETTIPHSNSSSSLTPPSTPPNETVITTAASSPSSSRPTTPTSPLRNSNNNLKTSGNNNVNNNNNINNNSNNNTPSHSRNNSRDNSSKALSTLKSPIRPEDSASLMHKTRAHLDFVGRVNLTILDESHSVTFQDIPFVQISMGDLTSDFWGWEDYSFITTNCLLKVEVFNYKHMAFDSLIEQFPLNIQVLKSDDPKLKISIKAEDLVNINISHPFIASLAKFYENIQNINEKERYQQAKYYNSQQQQQQQQLQHHHRSNSNSNNHQSSSSSGNGDNSYENDDSIPRIDIELAHSNNNLTQSSSGTKPISIPSSPSKSSLPTFGSQNDLQSPRGSIEALRWKKAEPNVPLVEKPSLSASIIASTKRDSMKSSVIMTHFNTNGVKHRRQLSGSVNSQQLFNTVGQSLFWIVNLTGKDIQYYVEELQLVQQQPTSSLSSGASSSSSSSLSQSTLNAHNSSSRELNPKLRSSYDPVADEEEAAELEAKTKVDRAVHFLKNREKKPLELNSVLFKTRDFRTHGNLNAHIAFRFTDSEEDQWIHGVSINMMGDNFYFPPFGNRANLIVCEVGWNESNDNKIATLRSPVIVRNSCTIPIDILVISGANEQTIFGPIAVGDNFYIPVDFFNFTSRISIRPAGHDFIFDMEHALDLVDSSSWPTSHLFMPYKEDGSSSHGSSNSLTDYRSMLHFFYLATLVQSGIRCERTGLISTTLIICPPLIIENTLYCDINVRVHSHSEVKRNKSDYNKSVQQHPPALIASGKQIPFYTHAENDVGVTLALNGLGKEQYFHLQYMLTSSSTTGLNIIDPTEDSGSFTQEVTYQCVDTGYNLTLKIDHRFEGGCHIASIYTTNAITNHAMNSIRSASIHQRTKDIAHHHAGNQREFHYARSRQVHTLASFVPRYPIERIRYHSRQGGYH
ncbi:hypothetical protein PPL_05989 [Heterostelium album PN500]|uniref:Uncharacterized protein n=1 Tax=Heterostelium pallidum (strain ATCC 26659 / Pp 5 / PN500) TaxID=670386 RepID=D3BBW9_HETP5|nr:hypothetical protein PPL_05989 [Heterostelium album PN500]EFA81152.1 hypothetical protein PPL_05989 [Heterostelium album PN500]|eukprot:XP_020433270.1 hypothetical protein PPL_05989 [Heterostelium album PN500]